MEIARIKVDARKQRKLGDIPALAESIKVVGLLHPIVVNGTDDLIAGTRRLAAVKSLGWTEVPVNVCNTLDDIQLALRAEQDENTFRLDPTPSEAVALKRLIEPKESKTALERKKRTGGNLPPQKSKGKVRDQVASAVGMSATNLAKAEAVVKAAESHPNEFADIAEEMDRTGKVDPAYKELAKRSKKPNAPKVDLPRKVEAPAPVEYSEPWGQFNADISGVVSDLRSASIKLSKILGWNTSTKKLESPWAHYYSHAGTVGQINATVRNIEDNKPAAIDPKAPGYISAKSVEMREAMEKSNK